MTITVIDDPGYRMSPTFRERRALRNLTEHQTFFSANEQRRRPGAASAEAPRCNSNEGTYSATHAHETLSLSIVSGNTKPSARMMATVEGEVGKAIDKMVYSLTVSSATPATTLRSS